MSLAITISPGEQVIKDPQSQLVYTWDWTLFLPGVAAIATSGSTFAIDDPPDGVLTIDNPSVVSGSKMTRIRIIGGTLGAVYAVRNRIVTNETPAQTKDGTVYFKIAAE